MSFISDYLTFTRKERNGILVLVSLILVFAFLPFFYPLIIKQKKFDHSQFEKQIAALEEMQADSSDDNDGNRPFYRKQQRNYAEFSVKAELFEFDPNTLPAEGWKRLGIKDKTVTTIQNYLSKGGKFYKAEDISKIWGLHPDQVKRLLPYIRIAAIEHGYPKGNSTGYEKKSFVKEIRQVDINSADSSILVELPGIGAGFARRIINFRNKLGGFVSVDQIAETYGLPDSTFQTIKPRLSFGNSEIRQININTATADELKQHPYIRYDLANAIVQYRLQHGSYMSVNDIRKIMMVTDEVFNKISPYLKATD
jgi:competence protein ComEA